MKKSGPFLLSVFIAFCFLFVSSFFPMFAVNKYNIIPYPNQLIPDSGSFKIDKYTLLLFPFDNPEFSKMALQFSDQIKLVSGIKLKKQDIAIRTNQKTIEFVQIDSAFSNIEAYRLQITPRSIRIEAKSANGFFYGLQTLYQLLPPEIYGKKRVLSVKWIVPAVQIADAPRFAYRGLHLDVCRHFFPVEFIKKYIDAMAIHKLNQFHWHLTDDQGWRIEIKKYPRLTEVGSKRDETLKGYYYEHFPQQFDGKPYGGFYTQEEAREIVAYAAERFITVIPEIEMPGHAQAAIAAYPFLSCNQDTIIKVDTRWGISKNVYCPRDTTIHFLENVLSEIMNIFPSKYIHIGGDECPKDRWKTCPDCQVLIKKLDLKDENGLQSYFVERIEQFVNSKGRKIIGWDEILDGGLAPNATVMSWRGINGGIAAAKSGHDVIMTPGAYCYLDKYQAEPTTEPMTIGGFLPLEKVYGYEPIPTELTEDQAKYIIGAQGNVWTEYMPDSRRVEYMAFPRVSALSEVVWTNKENRNWDRFRANIPTEFKRYNELNIQPSKAFYAVQFQPLINAEGKLQLKLVCDDSDAEIHYTTDSSTPTVKNALYTSAITLHVTTTITAAAFVNGTMAGKPLSKLIQVSKLTGLPYTQNVSNTWYTGGNPYALTDGVLGNTKVTDQWVGVGNGSDAEIIIDMKTDQSIERFSVGLLSLPAMCGILSPEIQLYGSTDGLTYQLLAKKELNPTTSGEWEMFRPELTFPIVNVRFLKLLVKNAGICPSDRLSGSGQGSLLFMDEIGAW